ncbi:MAG TPA: endonuclease [Candidatus Magasanikbacteria bacterium]|nr:MAG: hypothetical protein A2479_03200 [Candidatus Magasanikbacteria bacterium RIFOXYC2_FULL_39_8]HAT03796.1 endonuclease [Candidatus Magasanikbacteria bacterium]
MFYVYILQSRKDNRYYIGSTGNLNQRLENHNQGLVKSTKSRLPFELIHYELYKTLSEARKRENQIKRYKGGNEFKKILQK